MAIKHLYIAFLFAGLAACKASKQSFRADHRYSVENLQKDYHLFRKILEKNHPSLYWYISKDSLDYYFNQGYSRINKPMTTPEFKSLLSYVISNVRCGHTSVRYSASYSKYLDTARLSQFPLSIKFWKDTAVVYANLNRRDSLLVRGTRVDSINGLAIGYYRDSLFRYLPMDGFSIDHKYQTLSNRGGFSSWYRTIFGLKPTVDLAITDTANRRLKVTVPLFNPVRDSLPPRIVIDYKQPERRSRKARREMENHNLVLDSSRKTGYFVINSFLREAHLGKYMRKSFRRLRRERVQNLIVDVRYNGGGNVGLSNLLTKFLIDRRFRIADSLYANTRSLNNLSHISNQFWYSLSMHFITRRRADGLYHFGYFERHFFRPKKKNHFNGNVYLITGANSFSATTLVTHFLKGQKNVTIVGEETGGGAYGNTAWLIPTATLPVTGIRFTVPRFRMVIDKNMEKNGRGIMPDVYAGASLQSIREGGDPKLEKVLDLIRMRESR